jgi:hypothetical protein
MLCRIAASGPRGVQIAGKFKKIYPCRSNFGVLTENKPLFPDTREEFEYIKQNYLKNPEKD